CLQNPPRTHKPPCFKPWPDVNHSPFVRSSLCFHKFLLPRSLMSHDCQVARPVAPPKRSFPHPCVLVVGGPVRVRPEWCNLIAVNQLRDSSLPLPCDSSGC